MRSFPVRRNTVVLSAVLFLLAVFAWAGWANWEYRRQESEKRTAAAAAEVTLSPAALAGGPITESPLKGKAAPAFTLEDLTGKKVSLARYKGKVVLINFWATWCGPCKLETPWLIELRNKYGAKGFEVLGIDSEGDDAKPGSEQWGKDRAAIDKFAREERIPYPVLVNGDSLAKAFGGLDDLPASFYVDRKGTVVMVQVGIDTEETIEGNIRKMLE